MLHVGDIVQTKENKVQYEVLCDNVVEGVHLRPLLGGHFVWMPLSWIEKVEECQKLQKQ